MRVCTVESIPQLQHLLGPDWLQLLQAERESLVTYRRFVTKVFTTRASS